MRLVFPDPYEEQPEFSGRNVEIEVLVTAIDFSQYVETNKNALWEIAVDTSTVLQYPEAELREYEEDFRGVLSGLCPGVWNGAGRLSAAVFRNQ